MVGGVLRKVGRVRQSIDIVILLYMSEQSGTLFITTGFHRYIDIFPEPYYGYTVLDFCYAKRNTYGNSIPFEP